MELYPAIDLRGGKVVRLRQGEASAETRYGADPVAQAEHFAEAGFSYLHIVDLDSALARAPHSTNETTANHRSILEILKRVSLPVQLGGGIRSQQIAETWLNFGVARLLVSTLAVRQPQEFSALCKTFATKIWVSIDLRDGRVADQGWQEESALTASDLVHRVEDAGAGGLVRTDILRDGTGAGIDAQAAAEFATTTNLPVIIAGGVATLDDLKHLQATGKIAGAVLGRALYEGAITPAQAVALRDSWRT